jgi:APA family basic amino acid/polyamine antiporter
MGGRSTLAAMSSRDGLNAAPALSRKLGLFGGTMAVIGGIVGAGIFINSYLVAQRVHTAPLILLAWVVGGLIALAGGAIYAELAARMPVVGGQYAYLRDALHPAIGFVYGWVLLLVIQTGGMAAVAIIFARYLSEISQWGVPESLVAALTLAILTAINCLGVKAGSGVQSFATLAAICAIIVLEVLCLVRWSSSQLNWAPVLDHADSLGFLGRFGAALTPVLFAYGGWQTSTFLGGELRDPGKALPKALILGVTVVIVLYTSVNLVYLHVLGVNGLQRTTTPASTAMLALCGPRCSRFIAAGVAFSAFGFLAQSILTAPRVYYAMARDGVFFRSVGWVNRQTHVPVIAIAVQGTLAIVIALTGTYVVAVDCTFFGLTAACLFVVRTGSSERDVVFRVPGHPWTTLLFIGAEWAVVASTAVNDPVRAGIGFGIALAGLPAYLIWNSTRQSHLGR